MMDNKKPVPNAGQAHYPPFDRSGEVHTVPFDPAPALPSKKYVFHKKWADSGYVMLGEAESQLLVGVTPEMLDWFWANLEKVYYLWAPGEHLSFQWEVAPADVGYEGSTEFLYETNHTYPVHMRRLGMENYPFTECLEHCWISEGTFGDTGYGMRLIHMYEAVDGGTNWTTIKLLHRDQAEWMKAYRSQADPEKTRFHNAYESGRFKDFLPQVYALWKDHPDQSQNISFDLRTKRNPDGTWAHVSSNRPNHSPEDMMSGRAS